MDVCILLVREWLLLLEFWYFISLFTVIVGYFTRSFRLYFHEVKENIYRWRIYPFRRAGSESSNYRMENHLA